MGTVVLLDAVSGATIQSIDYNGNLAQLRAALNAGIDKTNLDPNPDFPASCLHGYPSDVGKLLRGDGTWGPAGTLICDQGPVAAQASFDTNVILGGNIPNTYKHLLLKIVSRTDSTSGTAKLQINGDVGVNYRATSDHTGGVAIPAAVAQFDPGVVTGNPWCHSGSPGDVASTADIMIFDYAQSTYKKRLQAVVTQYYAAGNVAVGVVGGSWNSAAAIVRLVFSLSAGNLTEARFSLYGFN